MKLVFHADDFGLSQAVNAGIVEACERGVLRSTSLMVTGDAAEDAVALAAATRRLDVGLHLTLVEERPVLSPDRIPTLLDGERFWPSHAAIGLRYLAGRWDPAEARDELEAQWERFRGHGLRASHCDGHQHLHLLPGLFPAVVAQARRQGVGFVRSRLVGGPLRGGLRAPRRALLLATRVVSGLARRRVPAEAAAGAVPFPTLGFVEAGGRLGVPQLLGALDALARDPSVALVEVMLHPGHRDADTAAKYGHWGYHWERDLALLLEPGLPDALAERGIEITSFAEMASPAGASPGHG